MQERLGIAGSGAIACGLAVTAARHGEVVLYARSGASADRARASVEKICGKLSDDVDADRVRVETDLEALGKTPVEVPDVPGFVVNRLLFPYLFSAVELLDETGMDPADVDRCMTLGAGHPMGPLALLDFVGLDVSIAIGDAIGALVPARLRTLVAEGATGRKAGRGLYDYEAAAA